MTKKPNKTKQIVVRLTEDTHAGLVELGEHLGRTQSDTVRLMVKGAIQEARADGKIPAAKGGPSESTD